MLLAALREGLSRSLELGMGAEESTFVKKVMRCLESMEAGRISLSGAGSGAWEPVWGDLVSETGVLEMLLPESGALSVGECLHNGCSRSMSLESMRLSRAEYYLRTGLPLFVIEELSAALTQPEPREVRVDLRWGESLVENPPVARMPTGCFDRLVWVVIRVEEVTGVRVFIPWSVWESALEAKREVGDLDSGLSGGTDGVRMWHVVELAGLANRPTEPEVQGRDGSNMWLVGRIVGEDTGTPELFASSIWWSRSEAQSEVVRLDALPALAHYGNFRVWPVGAL